MSVCQSCVLVCNIILLYLALVRLHQFCVSCYKRNIEVLGGVQRRAMELGKSPEHKCDEE